MVPMTIDMNLGLKYASKCREIHVALDMEDWHWGIKRLEKLFVLRGVTQTAGESG